MVEPDWKLAKCRGVETELFFTEGQSVPAVLKMYCNYCPIQVQCANFAIVNHINYGVWGYTARRRAAIFWHMFH